MIRKLLLAVCLLFALPAWCATIVQVDKINSGSGTTHAFTFPVTVTTGCLVGTVFITSGTLVSVETTGVTNTMTQDATAANFEGTDDGYAYSYPNASSSVTGITITTSTNVNVWAVIYEVCSYNTSTPFDAFGTKAGTFSVNSTRVNVTTNADDSVAIGIVLTSGTSGFTAESGYTEIEDDTVSVGFQSNTGMGTAGAKVTGGTISPATYCYGVVATYRNATGGGGSPAPRRSLLGVG